MRRYIIIGGVAAGATAAARLRRLDEQAEIVLLERGPNVSYANCGLPYYIGGEIASRVLLFVTTSELIRTRYNVDVRERTEATAIDPDKHEVTIRDLETGDEETLEYTKLLIATGSTPIVPPLEGIDGENVFTLWTVPDVDAIKQFVDAKKPKRAVVVGGGFIGLEMVENLVNLGIEVDLVEMLPQVMAPLDPDMSRILENHLRDNGVGMYLDKALKSIHDNGRRVKLADGTELDCDMVVLSIGIRPNNALPKAIDLELNERGYVKVNDKMQTSVDDIYAAGDLVEVFDMLTGDKKNMPLAGPANKQGRIAADHMVMDTGAVELPQDFIDNEVDYRGALGTSVARVFELSCAGTGHNEKTLKKRGLEYGKDYAYSLVHPKSHAGYFPGALPLTIKLIFSLKEDGKILGAQIVGYDGVDKRIDVISTAMYFKGTVRDLIHLDLAYAPPYSSAKDPVNMAAYAATNILDGISVPFRVEDWEDPKRDPNVRLLSVLEDAEQVVHSIEGAVHIPLSQLRDRIDELDHNITYVPFCAIGVRGYLAERILRAHGFKTKNLLGGIKTWNELHTDTTPRQQAPFRPIAGQQGVVTVPSEHDDREVSAGKVELLDACGLSCPGPIVEVSKVMKNLQPGQRLEVTATDPGFTKDIQSWCDNTGNCLINTGVRDKKRFAVIEKLGEDADASAQKQTAEGAVMKRTGPKEKTMIVFDGDLDKAIAAFIIANGSAAMGNKVNMFFTFWGLNVIRKPEKVKVKKSFMGKMFGMMMPRGSKKLGLSKMNFGGLGAKMIRGVMKKNDIDSLEDLIRQAQEAGVKMTACQMSMDVMGITHEELIDGVEVGGVATMLNDNDRSNMNLFI